VMSSQSTVSQTDNHPQAVNRSVRKHKKCYSEQLNAVD
jgi:hypothetical protein